MGETRLCGVSGRLIGRRAAQPALTLFPLQAALIAAWSGGFVGYRFAAAHAPTMLVSLWRFAAAALLLLPLALPALRGVSWPALGREALVGTFAITGTLAPMAKATELGVPAGLVALAANLLPAMVAGLSAVLPGQRAGRPRWLGIGLGFLGVVIVASDGVRLGSAPGWAYALPVAGTLSLAVATLIQGRHGGTTPPLPATLFVQSAVSVPGFAALALLEGRISPILSAGFGLSLLWLVLVPTLGGYGLYWLCLRLSSPESTGGALYLSLPVTMVWAHAAFGDPLSPTMAAGAVLSLAGLFCLDRAGRP